VKEENKMLTCSIVYASPNTNARRLAETMEAVVGNQCIYMGAMSDKALNADVIFWGGNTDTKTPEILAFEKKLQNRVVVEYGHLCIGGAKDLYAIGNFAQRVMQNAERIAAEERVKKMTEAGNVHGHQRAV
jgi:hypothetical protein